MNILPAPIKGITKIEDCANGCSLHPECKAYVFYSNGDCYFKSSDDIPLVDDPDTKSGSLNQCSHAKNAQDVLTINPLWPDCILKKVNFAGQGKGNMISIFWGVIFDLTTNSVLQKTGLLVSLCNKLAHILIYVKSAATS